MKKDKKEVIELTGAEKVAEKTEKFFYNNWKKITIVCAVIAIALVILAVVTVMDNNKKEKQFTEVFNLEQGYNSILSLDNTSDEFNKALADLNAKADALIADADGYPEIKAKYIKALAAMVAQDWNTAASSMEDVAVAAKDTYLVPAALVNAAVAYENAGSQDKALELYNKVWNDFGKDCPEGPKALFNVARIYEAKGDTELAKATYSQLVDTYLSTTGSEYARIANARLITL
ncbi:MAG: tetratricopeptide repeat protein [Sphaerochaetaceae bacterium]|nr:tetratricopeptide repeat protein [Sphaerochaetaceae bacterium]